MAAARAVRGEQLRGVGGQQGGGAPRRRRQRERSDATVEDLLAAARALFADGGYADTSLDAVCERAGVTKGALYHHFEGKKELFGAVYVGEQEMLAAKMSIAYLEAAGDPWTAVLEGCRAYLEAVLDPEVQRVVLVDAPGALGWEAMRTLGTDCRDLIRRAVERAIHKAAIPPRPADALASLLYGGLGESAMAVTRAEDPQGALKEAVEELGRLFEAIARG